MISKWAMVSDFDGTISEDDFFWFIADKYLDDKALKPWTEYLRGDLTHLEALNTIFSKIHLPESELQAFIKTIKIDNYFEKVAQFCRLRDIPFYICSAGCDYYINSLIGRIIRDNGLNLVTNHGIYSQQAGLKMVPPADSPFYDEKVGINKLKVVDKLRGEGYKVVFAGDGPPDFEAAKASHTVFAKKILLEKCLAANIKTQPFTTFEDIYAYLKEV